MRIIRFDEQKEEAKRLDLSGPEIDSRCFAGQDAVVYRDKRNDTAIHVYHSADFGRVARYARTVNSASEMLKKEGFRKDINLLDRVFALDVEVNPVIETGEKEFVNFDSHRIRPYTFSPFIHGLQLCWPARAVDDEQRMVARCFGPDFYDELSEWISKELGSWGIDINPVNVKYKLDSDKERLLLIITDLAKDALGVMPREDFEKMTANW